MYAVKNRWIVLVVLLCSILCLWGCRGSQAEAPIAGKTGVNGSGNGVNGGLICSDGGSGLYVSHPEDGRLLHIADGAVTRVGDVENVSQLNYSAGRLYFCADRGINDDNGHEFDRRRHEWDERRLREVRATHTRHRALGAGTP